MKPGAGPVGDVRVQVVAQLRARRGELVEAIFARVRGGAFARAGAGDVEYMAGLRAAVAAALEYGLQGIERGEEGVGPIPPAVSEQARRAARVGVSLDTVLRRYVLGHTLLEEYVMEEAHRGGYPDERSALRAALRAQGSVLDRLLAAITVEYGDELARAGRSPEQRRAELVRRLLDGDAVEHAELGYELGGWHLGVIATGADAARAVGELASVLEHRLLSVAQGESVWVWLGGRERFAPEELERGLAGVSAQENVVLALGEPGRGFGGWRMTHRQAQAALMVARRRPHPGGVTRYADVALLAFALGDEALAASLIEVYLAPLDEQRDGGVVLRRTLRAYFAAGRSASSAAAALGVVRSTVENRLRAVEQSLGRSLLACLAELEVALRLEELDGLAGGEHRPGLSKDGPKG
jgi:PucR-like helix-turn-helix protein/diguanylate cyclase with GGDEF domain